jgi:hypothetical protein
MSKFVIECPVCGRYAEAGTGSFARKKLGCACAVGARENKLSA